VGRDRGVALLGKNWARLCPLFPDVFRFRPLTQKGKRLTMFYVTVGIGWHVPIPMPQVGLEPG
jgi:hypothetical protein